MGRCQKKESGMGIRTRFAILAEMGEERQLLRNGFCDVSVLLFLSIFFPGHLVSGGICFTVISAFSYFPYLKPLAVHYGLQVR